jgi:hypothetical protein
MCIRCQEEGGPLVRIFAPGRRSSVPKAVATVIYVDTD